MSRSVRIPTSRPLASHTKTESPTPARWIARRQSARLEPGGIRSGSRRDSTASGSWIIDGTRPATSGSVGCGFSVSSRVSVTLKV